MPEANYLLFIDEKPVDEALKTYFGQFNINIIQQTNLTFPFFNQGVPIAILIDWSLLKKDLEFLLRLYNHYAVPLLVISDIADESTCIQVLEAGADDFLIKPIYPRELHARVSAINRRVLRRNQPAEQEKEIYSFTHWRLYPASRKVINADNNQELLLSMGEYDLLLTFVQQPQRVLDREFLLQITKNSDLNPFDRRIDVQISRLRQKIEVDIKKPALIKTIRNGGYMFTAEVKSIKEP